MKTETQIFVTNCFLTVFTSSLKEAVQSGILRNTALQESDAAPLKSSRCCSEATRAPWLQPAPLPAAQDLSRSLRSKAQAVFAYRPGVSTGAEQAHCLPQAQQVHSQLKPSFKAQPHSGFLSLLIFFLYLNIQNSFLASVTFHARVQTSSMKNKKMETNRSLSSHQDLRTSLGCQRGRLSAPGTLEHVELTDLKAEVHTAATALPSDPCVCTRFSAAEAGCGIRVEILSFESGISVPFLLAGENGLEYSQNPPASKL